MIESIVVEYAIVKSAISNVSMPLGWTYNFGFFCRHFQILSYPNKSGKLSKLHWSNWNGSLLYKQRLWFFFFLQHMLHLVKVDSNTQLLPWCPWFGPCTHQSSMKHKNTTMLPAENLFPLTIRNLRNIDWSIGAALSW